VPLGLALDGANRHDRKLVRVTRDRLVVERPSPTAEQPQERCLDKGYDYAAVRAIWQEFGFTAHIRGRVKRRRRSKPARGSKSVGG
jgi:hypothetical protein